MTKLVMIFSLSASGVECEPLVEMTRHRRVFGHQAAIVSKPQGAPAS
jgi:hypothetical protein